jgi:hypothetical protein
MTSKTFSFNIVRLSSLLMTMLLTAMMLQVGVYASIAGRGGKQSTSAPGSTQQNASDLKGTFSGTFYSKHSRVAPFTMTVVINPDVNGHLIGSSTFNSECLKDAHLKVTVTGSTVVLAGSDKDGNNITVRGTLDSTGTLMQSTYILNGSATGRCETDQGTGTLGKQ